MGIGKQFLFLAALAAFGAVGGAWLAAGAPNPLLTEAVAQEATAGEPDDRSAAADAPRAAAAEREAPEGKPVAGERQALGSAEPADPGGDEMPADPRPAAVAEAFPVPPGAKRLAPDARLWVDRERRRVIVDGYVAVRDGMLEMFACPAGTKEHESVVAVLSKAQYVHAALLAVGATPGSPVRYDPEYAPASGTVVKVWVLWKDASGKEHAVPAQQWVCRTGTDEPLKYDWVFGGSGWWEEPGTGRDYYMADSGDLICVSNFGSATMDLPIESTAANSELLYSACTERIPPRNTPVRLVLVPQLKEPALGGDASSPAEVGDRLESAESAAKPSEGLPPRGSEQSGAPEKTGDEGGDAS